MTDPSPFLTVATAVITVFNAEFADEGWTMQLDDINEALGNKRVAAGVNPIEEYPMDGNEIVQETWVEAKLFLLWRKQVDPDLQVDPSIITGYAERFRTALRQASATDPGTGLVWYFSVRKTDFPRDPTGNRSRFVMTIRAFGDNAGLIETTG